MPYPYRSYLDSCGKLLAADLGKETSSTLLALGSKLSSVKIQLESSDDLRLHELCSEVIALLADLTTNELILPKDAPIGNKVQKSRAKRLAPMIKAAAFYAMLGDRLGMHLKEQLRSSSAAATSEPLGTLSTGPLPSKVGDEQTLQELLPSPAMINKRTQPPPTPLPEQLTTQLAVSTLTSLTVAPGVDRPETAPVESVPRRAGARLRFLSAEKKSTPIEAVDQLSQDFVLDAHHDASNPEWSGGDKRLETFLFKGQKFLVGQGYRRFDGPPGKGRIRAYQGNLWRFNTVDGTWRDEDDDARYRRLVNEAKNYYALPYEEKCKYTGFTALKSMFEAVYGQYEVPTFDMNGQLLPPRQESGGDFAVREVDPYNVDLIDVAGNYVPNVVSASTEYRRLRGLPVGNSSSIITDDAPRSALVKRLGLGVRHEHKKHVPPSFSNAREKPDYAEAAARIRSQKPANSSLQISGDITLYPAVAKAIRHGCTVAISGPPGTGKSIALSSTVSFCKAINDEEGRNREVFGLNLVHKLDVRSYSIEQLDELLEAAKTCFEEGKDAILLIDEYEMLPVSFFARCGDFAQIIACGDYGQRLPTSYDQPVFDFVRRAGGASFEFNLVWRCHNVAAFNSISALLYGGRFRAHLNANRSALSDTFCRMKLLRCPADLGASALALYMRAMYLLGEEKNKKATVAIIADSSVLRDTLAVCVARTSQKLIHLVEGRLSIVVSSEIRGLEYDHLLLSSLDQDLQERSIEENLTMLSTVLGRSRERLDAVVPSVSATELQPGSFTDLLLPLAHVYVESANGTLEQNSVLSSLASDDLEVSEIEGVSILRRQDRKGLALAPEYYYTENRRIDMRHRLVYKYLEYKKYLLIPTKLAAAGNDGIIEAYQLKLGDLSTFFDIAYNFVAKYGENYYMYYRDSQIMNEVVRIREEKEV